MHFARRWGAFACAVLVQCAAMLAGAAAAAPTITEVTLATGGYGVGASAYMSVNFSTPVTVTGRPTMRVRIGSVDREYTYAIMNSATRLELRYVAQAGDNGTVTVTGPLALNGGSIKGPDGADASLAFAPFSGSPNTIFDTIVPSAPVVQSVTPSTPVVSQAFSFSGTASERGTISVRPVAGGFDRSVETDASGNWSIVLGPEPVAGTYLYDVTLRDRGNNLSPATRSTVTVANGPSTPGVPTITQISAPAGTFNLDHRGLFLINVTFSERVLVTGSPSLVVRIGTTTREITGSVNGQMIQFGGGVPQGVEGSLTITGPLRANGGTIKGMDGDDAVLSFAPVSAPQTLIDTIPPAPPVMRGISPASPTAAQSFTLSGTTEPGATIWFVAGASGSTSADASGNWSQTFPARPPGTYTILAYATDAAGNDSHGQRGGPSGTPFTFSVQPAAPAAGPAIAAITAPPAGAYNTPLEFRVQYTAPVTVTGTPVLTVVIGGTIQRPAPYVSGSGTNTLVFRYDSAASPSGPVTLASPLAPNGGTIRGADGADAAIAFTAPVFGLVIDNIPPTVPTLQATQSATPSFNGTADPGTRVTVHHMDSAGQPVQPALLEVTAAADGTWSATWTGSPLAAGFYYFIAISRDALGNASRTNGGTRIDVAATPPPTTPPPPTTTPPATTPLPVVITPPPGTTPPPVTPTPPTIASQTIDFLAPVSVPVMGQPFLLSASSSAGLPVTFSVVSGPGTISGIALIVTGPGPVVVRATQAGTATVAPASAEVTITGAVRAPQTITFAPPTSAWTNSAPITLAATASSGLPVAFTLVSGPATLNGSTLSLSGAAGDIVIRARQAGSETVEPAETTRTIQVSAAAGSRLANLSSRLEVSDTDPARTFITGFVIAGSSPQRVLIRAAGPALRSFGVTTALANPRLQLFDGTGRMVGENDDWSGADIGAAGTQVGAFALTAGSRDAALVTTLSPGAYTVHLLANGGEGVALAEVYDASGSPNEAARPPLTNLSARGYVGTGEAQVAVGFVISGNAAKRVLVRGVGPALQAFGVSGALADPQLGVYQGSAVIARNDDWSTVTSAAGAGVIPAPADDVAAATSGVGAFPLPANGKDAAILVSLAPGVYTAVVSGSSGTGGVALVEVYEVRD